MPIMFACDGCGQRYQVDDALGGKRMRCKKCETVLTIPGPAAPAARASRPPLQTFGAEPAPPRSRPPLQTFGDAAPSRPKPTPKPPADDLYGLDEDDGGPEGDPFALDEVYAPPQAALVDEAEEEESRPDVPKKKKKKREYAHFGLRLGAFVVDLLVLFVIAFGIMIAVVAILMAAGADIRNPITRIALQIGGVLINMLYFAAGHASEHQATLGKRALGIKVIAADGDRLSFGMAFLREFLKQLFNLLCCLGAFVSFITILATEKKQSLHDMIVGSAVVKSR